MTDILSNDVQVRAQCALATSSIFALRDLNVEHAGQSLLIFGRVDTFYHKQLAQEVVRAVSDGLEVVNLIAVE